MSISDNIKKQINLLQDPIKADILLKFFKTGKGQYGEGDIFLGIKVPELRAIAKIHYNNTAQNDLKSLLISKYHEERLVALFILVLQYEKVQSADNKKEIVSFYLQNKQYINNWDLVDLSCYKILGRAIFEDIEDINILLKLVKSQNLWDRRIAIVSTMYFIRKNKFKTTLEIAEILLNDKEDLINKAVGWLLREVYKKNNIVLEEFLDKHYKSMPRVTLRYAIERMEENKRKSYLKRK